MGTLLEWWYQTQLLNSTRFPWCDKYWDKSNWKFLYKVGDSVACFKAELCGPIHTALRLLLMEPVQILSLDKHLPSFFCSLFTLTALLTLLEPLTAWLPAQQIQFVNYLYTIWLLNCGTTLLKSLTFFILINLEKCICQPKYNELHSICCETRGIGGHVSRHP